MISHPWTTARYLRVPLVGYALALAFTLALLNVSVALGAQSPQSTSSFDIGNTHVDKYGAGEPALILIPGLTDSAKAWTATIVHFEPTHTIYALTLAGFGGRPAVQPPMIDKADADIAALITREHLNHPIVIGHSMGGFLTIRFAEEHSGLIGGAIAVDGLPVLAGMDKMTPEERGADPLTRMFESMAKATPDEFMEGQRKVLPYLTKAQNVDAVAALSEGASPAASASYVQELSRADLRPQLGKITVPLLELAPFDPTLDPFNPASPMKTATDKVHYYQMLLSGDKTAKVALINDSRHFIMFDQPQAFYDAVDGFLKTLR